MARQRVLPHRPRTTVTMREGDVIAVPLDDSAWGALHVVSLRRSGPVSRSAFVAGVLPWRGEAPPCAGDVEGLPVVAQALMGKELFTDGLLEIVANTPVVPTSLPNNFTDSGVIGARVNVWGWRAAIGQVRAWRPEED
ncbi:hypothetical protein [Microbacterium testaceum]|uniref:hypothetical protein n=1 Tax=Microbacterium testaceum TaxID=2033 RepID=UPI0025DDD5B9|nr:hypothetical protein [Microbacterium testaceum]MDZ5146279.1 hypothetical protein [Microbacterium testaceum]